MTALIPITDWNDKSLILCGTDIFWDTEFVKKSQKYIQKSIQNKKTKVLKDRYDYWRQVENRIKNNHFSYTTNKFLDEDDSNWFGHRRILLHFFTFLIQNKDQFIHKNFRILFVSNYNTDKYRIELVEVNKSLLAYMKIRYGQSSDFLNYLSSETEQNKRQKQKELAALYKKCTTEYWSDVS